MRDIISTEHMQRRVQQDDMNCAWQHAGRLLENPASSTVYLWPEQAIVTTARLTKTGVSVSMQTYRAREHSAQENTP